MSTKANYYRIAEKKHERGAIMKGSGKRPLAETEPHVETILEKQRPADCPDRGDCVYMLEECDFRTAGVPFDQGYVHTVEPLGKIDKRDLAWIGVIQRRYHKDSRLRKNQYSDLSDEQVADKYWSGEASDKPSWEWSPRKRRSSPWIMKHHK